MDSEGWAFPTEDVKAMKYLNSFMKLARLFRIKICMYAIDIDALQKPEYIELRKKMMEHVDFIITRNSTCASLLNSIAQNNKIISGVDVTHGLNTKEEMLCPHKESFLRKHDLVDNYII